MGSVEKSNKSWHSLAHRLCGISSFLWHSCICSSHVICNSSSSVLWRSSCVLCGCPYDHSSSCVLRSSHCHCSSSVLYSSHCHCSSSVLCSRSCEHGCSCVIRILWCSSIRRAFNQHRALIRGQWFHAFVASASESFISFLYNRKAASICCSTCIVS